MTDEPTTDWQKALAHLEENYKLYIAGVAFILVCVAIGALIRISMVMKEHDVMTRYAEAALVEDPAERLEKYQALVNDAGRWTPEVLYRLGETAIEAGSHETAKEAFERIIASHGASEYAVNATDGLAFLAWNAGDLDEALAGFERLTAQWPNEFVARRKYYDIGQVQEERGDLEAAIAAYRRQGEVFPESSAAQRADQALERLRNDHPDLFPEDADQEGMEPVDTEAIAQTPYVSTDAAAAFDAPTEETDSAADAPTEEEDAVVEDVVPEATAGEADDVEQ